MSFAYSKHARGFGLPIKYVIRNAHFSINSGANLSQIIISLHLDKNYYDYKNISTTWERDKLTVKLSRLTRSLRLIRRHLWSSQILNFNGHLLVHIRKFNGDFPTK